MTESAPRWKKPRLIFVGIITLALVAGSAVFWLQPNTQAPAPDVTFSLIDGSRLSLRSLRGKPVVVFFWASTCKTCIEKTPALNRLYQQLHPDGLEMIAVTMPYDPPTRALALAKKLEMPYPVALDIDASIVRAFDDVSVTPTTNLISPEGTVLWRKVGKLDMAQLKGTIEQLLARRTQTL